MGADKDKNRASQNADKAVFEHKIVADSTQLKKEKDKVIKYPQLY